MRFLNSFYNPSAYDTQSFRTKSAGTKPRVPSYNSVDYSQNYEPDLLQTKSQFMNRRKKLSSLYGY